MAIRSPADGSVRAFACAADNDNADLSEKDIFGLMRLATVQDHPVFPEAKTRIFANQNFHQWHAKRFDELRDALPHTVFRYRNDYRNAYWDSLAEHPFLQEEFGDFAAIADLTLRAANQVLTKGGFGQPELFLRRRFMMHALPPLRSDWAIQNCGPQTPAMEIFVNRTAEALKSLPPFMMKFAFEFGFLIRTGRDLRDMASKDRSSYRTTGILGIFDGLRYFVDIPRDSLDMEGKSHGHHLNFENLCMTLAHEIWHGIDKVLGYRSLKDDFADAYRSDCQDIVAANNNHLPELNYYMPAVFGGGHRYVRTAQVEAFVETLAEWSNNLNRISRHFPRSSQLSAQVGTALHMHYQLYPDMRQVPSWDKLMQALQHKKSLCMPVLKAA